MKSLAVNIHITENSCMVQASGFLPEFSLLYSRIFGQAIAIAVF
jgi:hypothetical protein